MKVLILAGGLGTRLKPTTNTIPKVMIKIGNKPVLEHLVDMCHHHHLTDIIVGLYYLPEKVKQFFGNKLTYSIESEPLGGAGAIEHAQKLIGNNPFIVLNGDVLTNVNLTKMIKFHQEKKGLATFLVHQTDHPYDSDIVEYNQNYQITKFFRPKPDNQFQPISKTGTHIFEPEVFGYLPKNTKYSLEKQLIPKLLKDKQKLFAYYSDCYSKDMGTPDRLKAVRKDYQDGKIFF